MEINNKQQAEQTKLIHELDAKHKELDHKHRMEENTQARTTLMWVIIPILVVFVGFLGTLLFGYDRVETVETWISSAGMYLIGLASGFAVTEILKKVKS